MGFDLRRWPECHAEVLYMEQELVGMKWVGGWEDVTGLRRRLHLQIA